ncbi:uncharacterized protein LOC113510149 isoform X2 [Galleria mellonella]|nr:uncharacterized protein LOC113510149 isoform X2 [Galleria mellonella]
MAPRLRASAEQFNALLEFMERHGDLSRPQVGIQERLRVTRLWQQLVYILNSKGNGVRKSSEKWKKVWVDWKTKTKKKAFLIKQRGRWSANRRLTAPEERVLAVMEASSIRQAKEQFRVEDEDMSSLRDYEAPTTDANLCVKQEVTVDQPYLEISGIEIYQTPTQQPQPKAPSPAAEAPASPAEAPSSPELVQRVRRPSPVRLRPRRRRRSPRSTSESVASEFASIEHRRLDLEEMRLKDLHVREMEKLRLEAQKNALHDDLLQIFRRLVDIAQAWFERTHFPNPGQVSP